MVNAKKIFLISIFLSKQIIYGMEQSHGQLVISTDDSIVLPITVNIENNKTIIYSTQFDLAQLRYLGILYNQYRCDQNNALSIPQEHVSKESFESIEKIPAP